MRRVLQLNTSWEPMNFVADVQALYLINKGRAKIVHNAEGKPSIWNDLVYRSANSEFIVPATIVLVGERVRQNWRPPRFRKKVLFNRDKWRCVYCRSKLSWRNATIDHVQPESKGGPTSWENCVAACRTCNRKKANKSLDEAKMILRFKPGKPSALDFWDISRCSAWHDDWDLFIKDHR